ncbi:MAG: hypothetical protein RLY40_678 [Pseudomonadota bacterium]|jgi:hypothetical protein
MALTKKQKNSQTTSQLYQYFISPKRSSRDFFQNTLQALNLHVYEIGTTLCRIRDAGILNLENFSLVLHHPLPFEIGSGLIQLHHSNLLTTENKKILEGHSCPSGIASVLRLLNSVNLLSTANRMLIEKQSDPHLLANVLFTLFYSNLFTQKNFDKLLSHPDLRHLSNKLQGFNRKNSLTQTLLEQLVYSQPEKTLPSDDLNKLRKAIIPSESITNGFRDPCRAHFFFTQKLQRDSESPSTIESLRIE